MEEHQFNIIRKNITSYNKMCSVYDANLECSSSLEIYLIMNSIDWNENSNPLVL